MGIEKYINTNQSRIVIGGKSMALPEYFPSVSSVKTSLSPVEYLRVLAATKHPQFLVSAYDLSNSIQTEKMADITQRAKDNRAIILMDSGNYESYWRSDRGWKWNNYLTALSKSNYHLAFSFDNQTPPDMIKKNITDTERQISRTLKWVPKASIIPILHGDLNHLPRIAQEIAYHLKPVMIAIPERELGEGMIERIKTLCRIRRALDETQENIPLHLLGTGNPLALLLFSAFGANSFDGLEWCKTAVDHKTGLLYHFQHREFFGDQSVFCSLKNIPYAQATLSHNLMFYGDWMCTIRLHLIDNKIDSMLRKYFSLKFLSTLSAALEEN